MGFNLSKNTERFDLSKSSNDDSESSSPANSSQNKAKSKVGSDKIMVVFVVLTILVIIINASLWYHVITSSSNPVSTVKNVSVVKPVQ